MIVFATAQKVIKHLGYCCIKICCQEIPIIAQSGHTVALAPVVAVTAAAAVIDVGDIFHLATVVRLNLGVL